MCQPVFDLVENRIFLFRRNLRTVRIHQSVEAVRHCAHAGTISGQVFERRSIRQSPRRGLKGEVAIAFTVGLLADRGTIVSVRFPDPNTLRPLETFNGPINVIADLTGIGGRQRLRMRTARRLVTAVILKLYFFREPCFFVDRFSS